MEKQLVKGESINKNTPSNKERTISRTSTNMFKRRQKGKIAGEIIYKKWDWRKKEKEKRLNKVLKQATIIVLPVN